jgi:MerR family transcriptional regulator, light-induced transcriptional regulator
MTGTLKEARVLSIGALARAAGIPVETLRTWERRYGFPEAERTSSGHRRYSMATLERLRRVLTAVQLGHRPSVVLSASEAELELLLRAEPRARVLAENAGNDESERERMQRWIDLVRRFDGRSLDRELRTTLSTFGALRFLELRLAPFVTEVGECWSRSEIGMRHEHFVSERLHEFLARHWQPLSDAASGPIVVCATPSGERHTIGLQMAAFALALNNLRVVFLGGDLPASEIAQAVQQHSASVIVLSAARGVHRPTLERECRELRSQVGDELSILVGGEGFQAPPAAVAHLESLTALDRWARDFARQSSAT